MYFHAYVSAVRYAHNLPFFIFGMRYKGIFVSEAWQGIEGRKIRD